MRLREIKHRVEEAEDGIRSLKMDRQANATVVVNLDVFLKAAGSLKDIEVLDFVIDPILSDKEFGGHYINYFNMSNDSAARLEKLKDKLIYALELIEAILDKLVYPQSPLSLSIKLYPIEDFRDINEFINTFQKKVLAPLNFMNEKIAVADLETGSKWINITIGTYLGFKLLTSVITSAFDILTHDYQKYRIASDIISQYEKENVEINGLRVFIEKQVEETYLRQASLIIENLKEDTSIPDEEKERLLKMKEEQINELRISLTKSLEETSKQIDKGLEIYASLDMPKDERAQIELPDFTKLTSLKKEWKLLSHDKGDQK